MRPREMLLLVALLVGSVSALGEEPPEPVRIYGKVKSVAPGRGAFEVEAKGGPYRFVRAPEDRLRALRGVLLRDLRWSPVHVLGRFEAATSRPDGTKAPEMITNVLALVAGQDSINWKPPPVRPALAKKGIGWVSGALGRNASNTSFKLEEITIQAPAGRMSASMELDAGEGLCKGALIFIVTTPQSDPNQKERYANEVLIVDPAIPQSDLREILGL